MTKSGLVVATSDNVSFISSDTSTLSTNDARMATIMKAAPAVQYKVPMRKLIVVNTSVINLGRDVRPRCLEIQFRTTCGKYGETCTYMIVAVETKNSKMNIPDANG